MGIALAMPLYGYSDTIFQVVSGGFGSDWNDSSIWDGDAPTNGNNYVTVEGLGTTDETHLGVSVSSRVRNNATTFAGDSITIAANTEVLIKANGIVSGNVVLDGGVLRSSFQPSANNTQTGTLHIASDSWIGVDDNDSPSLEIASSLTGSGVVLHIASGRDSGTSNSFDIIRFSGDLSGFSGTFIVGGGTGAGGDPGDPMLDFTRDYDLPDLDVVMGGYTNEPQGVMLDHAIKVRTFTYGTNVLFAGTVYTAADLNTLFGTATNQFSGSGTLEVYAPFSGPTMSPDILYFSVADGTVSLEWVSEVGATYDILRKTNLLDSVDWTHVKTNIVAAATNTAGSVAASGAGSEFCRIQGY